MIRPERFTLSAVLLLAFLSVISTSVAQEKKQSSPPKITCSLEMGEPLFFIKPGSADGMVKMLITNNTGEAISGKLLAGVRTRSTQAKSLKYIKDVSVPAGGTAEWPVPAAIIGNEPGIRYVDWNLVSLNGLFEGRNSFSVMNPVGITPGIDKSGDGFIFGMAGGMRIFMDYEYKKTFFRAAGIVGCEAYRVDLSWDYLQPSENEWRWKGLDELVEQAELNGMFIQPLLAYGNTWALSESDKERAQVIYDKLKPGFGKPGRPVQTLESVYRKILMGEDAWKNMCTEVAKRYGTKMQYYEIWNEGDMAGLFWLDTPENYVKLLRWSYEAIKKVNPEIIVTTTGFANTTHPYRNQQVVDETLSSGRDYFDVLAWHQHGGFDSFQKGLDNEFYPNVAKYNLTGRPILFNETGLGVDSFEREWEQAATLLKKRVFLWSKGAVAHLWYNLQRSSPQYMMVNSDWTPRAVYPAFNELSRQLRGRKFMQEINIGHGRWSYMFNGKGSFTGQSENDYVITSWVEDPGVSDYPALFNVGKSSRVWEIDLMGNRKELKVNDGIVISVVDKDPRYLVIENSEIRPVCTGALYEVRNPGAKIIAETANEIVVKLNNPLAVSSKMTLKIVTPPTVKLSGPSSVKLLLDAGESKDITFPVRLASGVPDLTVPFTIDCSANDGKVRSSSLIRIPVAFNVPVASDLLSQPMFILRSQENVVNNSNIIPGSADLAWKGEKDLSARIWLSGTLEASVEVTDDNHSQSGENDIVLTGDCVVISLAVPGTRGLYSFAVSTTDMNNAVVTVLEVPSSSTNKENLVRDIKATVKSSPGKMIYEVSLPVETLKLTEDQIRKGLLFNTVVHDADNMKYEGYIRLAGGAGDQKDTTEFASLFFKTLK